ncbi:SDR family NAD(P)-dependent oxidoreductase [Microbacterium sp. ASV49]|uniref:SDR family NAD(P)-dependent oxidoreductase n=1 Tax=Microbacterium candidum TaxID=3041922 RepID=A0ABT7MY33_9MICO|nr:SDR family NAD(P)-dependent oxidoreductase [Microbacterium sp. ASV49]MDL9979337.1 SDR family NAD(P)-dependent oxidoreductase [Microbacterium sp. ASV49]
MIPPQTFEGGLAVVTGAGSGIGEGIARHAAGLGMRVVIADVDAAAARRAARDLIDGGARAWAVETDVRDPAQVDALADTAFALGPVSLLVNNAGVEQLGYLWDTPLENWRRIVDINVSGVFHGIRSFVPRMIAADAPAHIWNLASVAAVKTISRQGPYIATKHAVLGMSEALQVDLARVGAPIRVGVVLPAAVATRIFDATGMVDAGDVAAAEDERRTMRELLATGSTPADAAREIFAQAANGAFYLLPQPEIGARIMTERGEQLSGRTPPVEQRTVVGQTP